MSYPPPPPPPSYGGQPPYGPPPSHPQAITTLVLGILGLVLCQLLAPVAWVMGRRVVREIDDSAGRLGGRDSANAGRILGIVGTALLGLAVVALAVFIVGAVVTTSVTSSCTSVTSDGTVTVDC